MARVGRGAGARPVAEAALSFCSHPLLSGMCPLVARTSVVLLGEALLLCPFHAVVAAEIDGAVVVWDDPAAEPLASVLPVLHRSLGDGAW